MSFLLSNEQCWIIEGCNCTVHEYYCQLCCMCWNHEVRCDLLLSSEHSCFQIILVYSVRLEIILLICFTYVLTSIPIAQVLNVLYTVLSALWLCNTCMLYRSIMLMHVNAGYCTGLLCFSGIDNRYQYIKQSLLVGWLLIMRFFCTQFLRSYINLNLIRCMQIAFEMRLIIVHSLSPANWLAAVIHRCHVVPSLRRVDGEQNMMPSMSVFCKPCCCVDVQTGPVDYVLCSSPEWHQFQWPWLTSKPDFKVTILFNVK